MSLGVIFEQHIICAITRANVAHFFSDEGLK